MKHFIITTIGLIYLSFLFINTDTLNRTTQTNKDGKYSQSEMIENSLIDGFNSIKNISIIKDTKDNLYKEANFDNTKKLHTGKEGFKRDYLALLYFKNIALFLCKIALFFFLIFLFIKTAKSIFTK